MFVCVYICVCVCVRAHACVSSISQSHTTLCDRMNCNPADSSVHGIFQARILEWLAISYPRGSSWPRDQTWITCVSVSCIGRWILYHWNTWEGPYIYTNTCIYNVHIYNISIWLYISHAHYICIHMYAYVYVCTHI